MAKETEIGTYTLELTKAGDAVELHKIGRNAQNRDISLVDWVTSRVSVGTWFSGHKDKDIRHLPLRIDPVRNHTVHFMLECGGTGLFGRTRHGQSGKLLHERQESDADMIPLYCQLFAPRGARIGVLAFQKTDGRTAHPFFNDTLRGMLDDEFPDLSLHVRPFVPGEFLEKLKGHGVQHIKITSYGRQSSTAELVLGRTYKKEEVDVEIIIKPKRGSLFPAHGAIDDLIKGLRGRSRVEIPKPWRDLGDKVTFAVNIGGKVRSMSFGAQKQVIPYINITRSVKWRDGRPNEAEVQREADHWVSDVARELGIKP